MYRCLCLLGLIFFISFMASSPAAETVRLGTSLRGVLYYDLVILAAEEKGMLQRQDLKLEWTPFQGSTELYQAMAAGSLDMSIDNTIGSVGAIARGLPVIIVAEYPGWSYFYLWVLGEGPIKEPRDLKGQKIGLSRFGGAAYAFTKSALKSLGLERDVKLVAVGGAAARMAALKTGVISAFPLTFTPVAELVVRGEIRQLFSFGDYLPKDWMDNGVAARKEFVEKKAAVARKMLSVLFEGVEFVKQNPAWAVDRMKKNFGLSEKAAELSLKALFSDKGPRVDRKGLENVVNFLIEYGLLTKEKVPPLDSMYTDRLTW